MIIQHQENNRIIGTGVVGLTDKQEEMFARINDGTFLYLKELSPMAAQKAADALRKTQMFNGIPMKRCDWVAANFYNIEKIDHTKKRIYLKSGTFFLFSDVTKTVIDYIEWLQTK